MNAAEDPQLVRLARPSEMCAISCANCSAPVVTGTDSRHRAICCATCIFHPLGCRCLYGDPPNTVNQAQTVE